MPANIQIPESLFYDILRYYILKSNGEEIPEDIDKRIIEGLTDKLQKIVDRELYTTYKTAKSKEEREKARQAYLDSKGIPNSFRW